MHTGRGTPHIAAIRETVGNRVGATGLCHHDEFGHASEDAIGRNDSGVDVQGGGGDPQVTTVESISQWMPNFVGKPHASQRSS